MSRLIAALLLLVLARPDALVGQAAARAASLYPGARVRITRIDEKPLVAIVVARVADTLVVRAPGQAQPLTLPLAEISRLDVSTGRHRNVGKGALVGIVAGGALGAVLGAASYQPCESTEFLGCLLAPTDRGESATLGGAVGGALGLVVGALIGVVRQDTWKRVPLDGSRVAVSVRPRAHGAGLGVSLQF
jgi:hypothetical protein